MIEPATALKKFDPEPVEFIAAFQGSPLTWIFWLVVLIWLYKVFAPIFKKAAPIEGTSHLSFITIFGIFWGLLEFTIGLSEICGLLLGIGSYSVLSSISHLNHLCFVVLWILLETAVCVALAFTISLFPPKKSTLPKESLSLSI